MPKIRRKSIENDFLLIFFCMQSEGVAQSSILMILRHPLFYIFLLQLSVYCVPCTLSLRAGLDIQADAAIGQMLIINIQGIVHIHQQTVRFFINFNPVGLYAYHHIAQGSGVA